MAPSPVIGIDLGGTKIEGLYVIPSAPDKALCRIRVPAEGEKGYRHVLGQIALLCEEITAETGQPLPSRIGIGTPGSIDSTTGACKNSPNLTCINGQPMIHDLHKMLGADIVVGNDANCFALAEATLGQGRGFETVFGVILGTGVGGGLVVNGQALNGRHGIAGEWGQIPLKDLENPTAKSPTIEETIAGPALARYYAKLSGNALDFREILARCTTGTDPHAQATIRHLLNNFARAIAIVIDVFDPHAIILGGGVGHTEALYSEETRKKIEAHIFNPIFETPIFKPILGDSAGVFGAALLASNLSPSQDAKA
jgi:predicted NBD/HSP70 family sugar kinase